MIPTPDSILPIACTNDKMENMYDASVVYGNKLSSIAGGWVVR
jgi:hypothetical protein